MVDKGVQINLDIGRIRKFNLYSEYMADEISKRNEVIDLLRRKCMGERGLSAEIAKIKLFDDFHEWFVDYLENYDYKYES